MTVGDLVRTERRRLNGQLDLRWRDFNAEPVPVVEADGRVVIERATESADQEICAIPAGKTTRFSATRRGGDNEDSLTIIP